MKIKHKKSFLSKKVWVIIILIVLLSTVATAVYFYTKQTYHATTSPETTDEAKDIKDKKPATYPEQTNSDSNPDKTSSQNNTDDASPPPAPGKASVTMASYAQENHQITTVVAVTGHTSTSNCTFTFSHADAKPVVRQVQVSGNSCNATAPEVEFSVVGLWQLNVSLYNGSTKLAETNQHVTVH